MKKEDLKESIEHDVNKMRGAMLEIISNNRSINKELSESLSDGDFSLLEEYNLITKSILDAAKVLTEVHSQTPKIIQEIDKIQQEHKKLDINDLLDKD